MCVRVWANVYKIEWSLLCIYSRHKTLNTNPLNWACCCCHSIFVPAAGKAVGVGVKVAAVQTADSFKRKMQKTRQQNHVRLNPALALKLTPPTAVRWSFVSRLLFFIHHTFALVWYVWLFLHWPFFPLCLSFHLSRVVFSVCSFIHLLLLLSFFFCFVVCTSILRFLMLFFVSLFFALSLNGVHNLFVYLLLLGFIRYSNNNFVFVLCLFLFLQNYYYFYQSIALPVHFYGNSYDVHTWKMLCTAQNRWKIVSGNEHERIRQTTRINGSNDHIQVMQWMSGWVCMGSANPQESLLKCSCHC